MLFKQARRLGEHLEGPRDVEDLEVRVPDGHDLA
jgi:hypothetical protein